MTTPGDEADQHGMPRTLSMLLADLIDSAYGDGRDAEAEGDTYGDGVSGDTFDLRDEILQRWPELPERDS